MAWSGAVGCGRVGIFDRNNVLAIILWHGRIWFGAVRRGRVRHDAVR